MRHYFFQEAFQIGIYWANTNTVHKSVAIKLVHNLTSPKWKDGGNGEVVSLDEEGFVDAEITLGAFPGHQKVGSESMWLRGGQGDGMPSPQPIWNESAPFSFLTSLRCFLSQTIYTSETCDFLDLSVLQCSSPPPLPVIKAVSHNLSNNHSISEHSAVTWFIVCRGKMNLFQKSHKLYLASLF